jgi:aerobic carbon-monoxide dehydrogenase medium subunit
MIPAAFAYARPNSVDEAIELLAKGDGSTKIIAGGHSILPLMKLRLARPDTLVDIGRLSDLRGIRDVGDKVLAIGALTTYDELLRDKRIVHGLLRDALPHIGDVQVRNRGTVGGSIAHADPASDMPALLLALDAEVVARSTNGERTIPIRDFFKGPFTTALGPDEILIEIRIMAGHPDYGSAYHSVEQPASGYSLAGAAVVVGRRDGGRGPLDDVRIALAGVSGDGPYRATAAEQAFLASRDPADGAAHAVDGVQVASDIHADAEFRGALAKVQVRRALEAAIERAE